MELGSQGFLRIQEQEEYIEVDSGKIFVLNSNAVSSHILSNVLYLITPSKNFNPLPTYQQ